MFNKFKYLKKPAKILRSDVLVKLSLLFFTVAQIDGRTSMPFLGNINSYLIYASILCVLINAVVINAISYKNICICIILGTALVLNCIYCEMHMPLFLFLLIFGLRKAKIEIYLDFEMKLISLLTFLICMLCLFGVYEDLIYIHGSRVQHCLGFSSWTILPFQYNAIVSYYIYKRKDKMHLWEYVLSLFLGFIIYKYTTTKSAFAYLLLLCLGAYVLKRIRYIKWGNWKFLILLPTVITIASYSVIKLYDSGSYIIKKIDAWLNFRITHASNAIARYGVDFLGHGTKNMFPSEFTSNYLVVDNSYISNLLMYGILGIVIILLLYSFLIKYSIERKDKYLLIVTIIFLLENIMWERLLTLPDFAFMLVSAEVFKGKAKINRRYSSIDAKSNVNSELRVI